MSDEATEEKKGKKKKEKKPKKEKPPKEKKPKKEKPPKEKKPKKEKPPKEKKAKKGKDAPEGAEGEEGGKKKGPPLLLILIPVFVVAIVGVAALVMFVILPRLRGGSADADEIPEDPDAALTAQVENTERAKKGDKSDDADAEASDDESADADAESGDGESAEGAEGDADGAEASPPEEEKSVDIVVSMTTSESIAYFRGLSPESLGLPGESMDDYDIFASEHLIFVDDVPCKEFRVYSIADKTGTNHVEGLYLMTQRGARKLYRLDEATNTVTELEFAPPAPAQPEPEPVPEGEALPEEEPPDHM